MKTSQFIFAFFFTSTAWAAAVDKLAFFAKFSNTYVPLSYVEHDVANGRFGGLLYGYPSKPPVKFNFNGQVVVTKETPFPGHAGFYQGRILFGRRVYPIRFQIDDHQKVVNYHFCSCFDRASRLHIINIQGAVFFDGREPYCFDVEIYLLPYHETPFPVTKHYETGDFEAPTKNKKPISDEVEQKIKPAVINPNLPMAFYAKRSEFYAPLISIAYGSADQHLRALAYGESELPPVVFKFDGHSAVANESVNAGFTEFAGFEDDHLVFGPYVKKNSLAWNSENKVMSNNSIYSCLDETTDIHMITSKKLYSHCMKVDIYLLPYDGMTNWPVPMPSD